MSASNAHFLNDTGPDFANPATGKLELVPILDQLHADGLISDENRKILAVVRSSTTDSKNVLQVIAECQWENQRNPGSLLTADTLVEWLSQKINVPVRKIDPLNIDVSSVTAVMSLAYAKRFNIIALEVTSSTIIVGTAEPFEQTWQSELSRVLRKQITCVLVSPEDIARYLEEFYSVS